MKPAPQHFAQGVPPAAGGTQAGNALTSVSSNLAKGSGTSTGTSFHFFVNCGGLVKVQAPNQNHDSFTNCTIHNPMVHNDSYMFPVANITPSCHNLQPVPAPLKGKLRRTLITECFILLEEGGSGGAISPFHRLIQGHCRAPCFSRVFMFSASISMAILGFRDFGYPESFSCTRKPANTTGLSSTRNPTPSSFNRSWL